MQCFIQGLQSDLKEHVILTQPQTYEAVDAARLKNYLGNYTTKPNGTQEIMDMLVSTVFKALTTTTSRYSGPKTSNNQPEISKH